jgi:hypothetical protein
MQEILTHTISLPIWSLVLGHLSCVLVGMAIWIVIQERQEARLYDIERKLFDAKSPSR